MYVRHAASNQAAPAMPSIGHEREQPVDRRAAAASGRLPSMLAARQKFGEPLARFVRPAARETVRQHHAFIAPAEAPEMPSIVAARPRADGRARPR